MLWQQVSWPWKQVSSTLEPGKLAKAGDEIDTSGSQHLCFPVKMLKHSMLLQRTWGPSCKKGRVTLSSWVSFYSFPGHKPKIPPLKKASCFIIYIKNKNLVDTIIYYVLVNMTCFHSGEKRSNRKRDTKVELHMTIRIRSQDREGSSRRKVVKSIQNKPRA